MRTVAYALFQYTHPSGQLGAFALACLAVTWVHACLVATQAALFCHTTSSEAPKLQGWPSFLVRRAQEAVAVLRIGKLACTLLLGLFLGLFLKHPLGNLPGWGGCLLVFVLASAFILFGIYLPKRVGLSHATEVLKTMAVPILLLGALLYPWAWLLRKMSGSKVTGESMVDSSMRLEALVGSQRLPSSAYLRSMIERTCDMETLELADVLVPRDTVVYFDAEASLRKNLQLAKESGHTRFPLCEGDLDKCVGIIHTKDIFGKLSEEEKVDLYQLRHPLVRFASNLSLEIALRRLLAARLHMAIVQDEFGSIIGLVTLEDIFEELVGDIDDEFDTPQEDSIIRVGANRWQVNALTPLHEFNDFTGKSLEGEDSATFGGFLTERIGRIPKTGEKIILEDEGLEVKVSSASLRRILWAEVSTTS